MSATLPFVNSTGALKRLLEAIKSAKPPATFTYDYMKNEMQTTERAMIPLLKKLGFLDNGGAPTELYRDFRNPDRSKITMGKAIEKAYDALYSRNEYIHKVKREELKSTIASVSGNDHDSKAVASTLNTFLALTEFASFDFKNIQDDGESEDSHDQTSPGNPPANPGTNPPYPPLNQNIGLNLGYTINLILPETTNIEVFNSIFKSINENLLKR